MIAKPPTRRTRIGKRNQVTIPVDVLRALSLEPGAEIQIELKPDGTAVLSKPVDPFAELERLREAFSRRPLAEGELELAIEEAKVERARMAGEKNERVLRQMAEHDR